MELLKNNTRKAVPREDRSSRTKERKLKSYKQLNRIAKKGQILFTGSSLCEQFPILELLQSYGLNITVYNRGIGGYVIKELRAAKETCIFDLEPRKIFINIGSNDIGEGRLEKNIIADYEELLLEIRQRLPETRIYVMAYYPANVKDDFHVSRECAAAVKNRTKGKIDVLNRMLMEMAYRTGCTYVDANSGLADKDGQMKKELCIDGIHMWPDAYINVMDNLLPYLAE